MALGGFGVSAQRWRCLLSCIMHADRLKATEHEVLMSSSGSWNQLLRLTYDNTPHQKLIRVNRITQFLGLGLGRVHPRLGIRVQLYSHRTHHSGKKGGNLRSELGITYVRVSHGSPHGNGFSRCLMKPRPRFRVRDLVTVCTVCMTETVSDRKSVV